SLGVGDEISFQLSQEMMEKVRHISEKHEITEFMFFLSAFALLMHKYTQNEDITFSTPFSHRQQLEIEQTVGNFVSMLPLRLTIREDTSAQDTFQNVFSELVQVFKHAKYPNNLIMRDNN